MNHTQWAFELTVNKYKPLPIDFELQTENNNGECRTDSDELRA